MGYQLVKQQESGGKKKIYNSYQLLLSSFKKKGRQIVDELARL